MDDLVLTTTEVVKVVESAFEGVERASTSLRQYRLTDLKGMSGEITDQEWTEAGRNRLDQVWQDIPDSEIEECGVLLAHMEPESFRYFLPAYLRYSLKHYDLPIWKFDVIGSTVFAVFPSGETRFRNYVTDQLSLLDKKQRLAVTEFLRFVANHADEVQRPDARKALDRFWLKDWSQIDST